MLSSLRPPTTLDTTLSLFTPFTTLSTLVKSEFTPLNTLAGSIRAPLLLANTRRLKLHAHRTLSIELVTLLQPLLRHPPNDLRLPEIAVTTDDTTAFTALLIHTPPGLTLLPLSLPILATVDSTVVQLRALPRSASGQAESALLRIWLTHVRTLPESDRTSVTLTTFTSFVNEARTASVPPASRPPKDSEIVAVNDTSPPPLVPPRVPPSMAIGAPPLGPMSLLLLQGLALLTISLLESPITSAEHLVVSLGPRAITTISPL